MGKWHWLSIKAWMYKVPLVLVLLLAIIDISILTKSFVQLTDDQIKLITPLVTFNSILLATAGIMYQVQATNEREMESKIHQQKRETYVQLLDLIAKFFENYQAKKGSAIDPATLISRREYMNLYFKLAAFGSEEVIRTFYKIQHPESTNPEWVVIQLGSLFRQMRKEVIFKDGDVTERELLSLWMTDVYDSRYDGLFMKLK